MARNGPTVAIYEFSFISKQSIYTNDKDGGRSKNLRGMIVKQHLFLLFSILVNNALQQDEGVGHVPPVLLQFCRPCLYGSHLQSKGCFWHANCWILPRSWAMKQKLLASQMQCGIKSFQIAFEFICVWVFNREIFNHFTKLQLQYSQMQLV